MRPTTALPPRSEQLARVGLVALLVALAIAAFETRATVVVMHSLEEMSQRADVIVHARVTDQEVKWEEGRIITLTEIEVLDGIKGAKYGEVLTIKQLGGTLDGTTVKVAGRLDFFPGEEMVYFGLRHREQLIGYGVGVGKFVIEYDASGDPSVQPRVFEDLFDLVVARQGDKGETQLGPPSPRSFQRLDSFKSELRGYLRAAQLPRKLEPKRIHTLERQGASKAGG